MADSQAIAAASETLRRTISDGLVGLFAAGPTVVLSDLVVGMPPADLTVTVFLFEIVEDPHSRNRPRRLSEGSVAERVRQRPPDMALLLRYLITAWGGQQVDSAQARRQDEQKILARIMQTFYDAPIMEGAALEPPLDHEQHSLKVTLSPLTLEERTRVWYAIQQPYRLSLSYEVRVLNLDTHAERETARVRQRDNEWSVPGVS